MNYANLDDIYLDDKEWVYVLNETLGFNFEEINNFREEMLERVNSVKHARYENISRYIKLD